jgi:hypothetical protein
MSSMKIVSISARSLLLMATSEFGKMFMSHPTRLHIGINTRQEEEVALVPVSDDGSLQTFRASTLLRRYLPFFQHALDAAFGLSHLSGCATPEVVSGWGTFVLVG